MSLKIRLARAGAKKRPFYHIVVADANSPRDGKFIERVGTYNPMLPADHADRVNLGDRAADALDCQRRAGDGSGGAVFLAKPGHDSRCRFMLSSRSSRRRRRRRKSGRLSGRKPKRPNRSCMDDRLILMGVIGKPHGVRGLVRVNAYTEDPGALVDYAPLMSIRPDGNSTWNGCRRISRS